MDWKTLATQQQKPTSPPPEDSGASQKPTDPSPAQQEQQRPATPSKTTKTTPRRSVDNLTDSSSDQLDELLETTPKKRAAQSSPGEQAAVSRLSDAVSELHLPTFEQQQEKKKQLDGSEHSTKPPVDQQPELAPPVHAEGQQSPDSASVFSSLHSAPPPDDLDEPVLDEVEHIEQVDKQPKQSTEWKPAADFFNTPPKAEPAPENPVEQQLKLDKTQSPAKLTPVEVEKSSEPQQPAQQSSASSTERTGRSQEPGGSRQRRR